MEGTQSDLEMNTLKVVATIKGVFDKALEVGFNEDQALRVAFFMMSKIIERAGDTT